MEFEFQMNQFTAFGRLYPVMLPPCEASVDNPKVERGNTAVFRCNVPEAGLDHVVITSWIQDNRYDIFLTSSQGRDYFQPPNTRHIV
jgi:hypothetical protein